MALVHPSERVSAKATCADVAWLDERVVNGASLRITTQTDYYTTPEPADILRMAGQSLPKVETLLAECAKHEDFVPPLAYTKEREIPQEPSWNECLRQGMCTSRELAGIDIRAPEPLVDDWLRGGDLRGQGIS
jgi:hypothetical protein